MHSLPIFLRINGRRAVVVGSGRLADRRSEALLAAGASVVLVCAQPSAALAARIESGEIMHAGGEFEPRLLDQAALVFALSDDDAENQRVRATARNRGLWCNSDKLEDSDFLLPAVIDRSPLLLALSTGGAAPALTRLLRVRLEAMVPGAYGRLANLIAKYRVPVAAGRNRSQRKHFWDAILAGPVAEKLFAGREQEASTDLQRLLDDKAGAADFARGEVYLVGGGPGAPDLLTFRALRLMQQADVVLYDSLISAEIVDLVRPDAERIYVGKRASKHTLPQGGINELMVELARQGKRVLRLKGGDPFMFGRGGEEIAELAEAGIPFQVVPGITAANGCASYAGIPLTHREYAQSVQFVTGHLQHGELDLDWKSLTAPGQTVVFFMGRGTTERICRRLTENGLPATHPAAMVIEGTTRRQQVVVADLASLPERVQMLPASGPGLIIIGEVVRLNQTLGWFKPEI